MLMCTITAAAEEEDYDDDDDDDDDAGRPILLEHRHDPTSSTSC